MPRNWFTPEEITLCTHAARFNADDFGGIDAIVGLTGRSRSSIVPKIRNIAAMLDEEGISRYNQITPLSGVPAGQAERRTNWDQVEPLLNLSRDDSLRQCQEYIQASR